MLLRLCQLKSLTLLLTSVLVIPSCAWRKEAPEEREILNTVNHNWYKANPQHALLNQGGEPVSHLFFDASASYQQKNHQVNVVVVTPKNSKHSYALDLQSGQRYYNHTYCKQTDVWNEVRGSIESPPFAIGYIPKVLDQLGEPQKVIVWTERKNFGNQQNTSFHEVRLLGGYIEQICPEGNCAGKGNWLSKLVFVGVDATDPELSGIVTLDQFKQKYDWPWAKTVLANMNGRNFIGEKSYPAYKISHLIAFENAFEYAKNNSIFLKDEELKKIQKGCHLLYDKLWDDVGKAKTEFTKKLTAFTKRYFKEISTCEKFVYHGNVNENPEKFWFLSHMGIYYRLHRDGYFFDCSNKSWKRNVPAVDGNPVFEIKKDLGECKAGAFDEAMKFLPNFLNSLKGEKDYYRFIEYDNHSFGTHQKLYSWVKVNSRRLDCSNDPNMDFKNKTRVYPEDVEWKKRNN